MDGWMDGILCLNLVWQPLNLPVKAVQTNDTNTLTVSERTSLLVGNMCSVRTKGSSGERISLSSSRSRSLLFTPRLFTLCAVPLNRLGSGEHTETYTVTHKYLSWRKRWPNFSSPQYRLDNDGWEGVQSVHFQRISGITMQLHWLLLCPWARN